MSTRRLAPHLGDGTGTSAGITARGGRSRRWARLGDEVRPSGRQLGRRRGGGIVPVVRLPLGLAATYYLGRGVGLAAYYLVHGLARLAVTAIRHPRTSLAVLAFAATWLIVGPRTMAIVAAILAVGVPVTVLVWRRRWPRSYRAVLVGWARSAWRRMWIYRRNWQPAMICTGLGISTGATGIGGEHLPVIRTVRSTATSDDVQVKMLAGQRVAEYAAVADDLARFFGARAATVRRDEHPNRVWLRFATAATETAIGPADVIDNDVLNHDRPSVVRTNDARTDDGREVSFTRVSAPKPRVGADDVPPAQVRTVTRGSWSRTTPPAPRPRRAGNDRPHTPAA